MVDLLQLDEATLANLDLDGAVDGSRPGNLFPSGVAWVASQQNPRLLRVVAAELARGYRLRPAEIVRVPKLDRTTRPAADIPQRDQLVYTALVSALRKEVPDAYVEFTGEGEDGHTYRDFEEYPLTVDGTTHVLEADAAAFYQFIDHDRLGYELIGLTGMAAEAEALVTALEGWMDRPRGLPQGPRASQPLADIYMSAAARSFARAGFAFSRFSDDFRIPVGSWADVRRAQMALEEAFYEIGLAVAPGKLRSPRIATYQRWLERANDPRITGASSRAALAAMEGEEYFSGGWEPGAASPEQVETAAAVLHEQMDELTVTVTTTRLVRRSLGILAAARSNEGLTFLSHLLSHYAHLTPAVSAYLAAILQGRTETAASRAVIRQLQPARTSWQVGWLMHTLSLASKPRDEVAEEATSRIFDDSLPWFARAAAARAAAVHGELPPLDDYFGVFERASDAARPDLVAAVVVADPTWKARFLTGIGTDPLLRDITEYGADVVRQWFS